jgi:hypothetical protein
LTAKASNHQDFASLVSVYSQEAGVVQLALMFNKKDSEITVAQGLLERVATTDALASDAPLCFSLDALHTQVATLALLEHHQCHYLIGLKGNQPKLYASAQTLRTASL